MSAAQYGTPDSVRILLEHGADINTKDKSGKLHTIIVLLSIYLSINITFFFFTGIQIFAQCQKNF